MVSGFRPLPVLRFAIFVASLVENSSARDSWTRNRFAAVQASPMLRIFAPMAPSMASSIFASSKTMKGAFPPSSMEVRRTFCAADFRRALPTGVEPVNESLRRRESARRGSETADAVADATTLSTPAGSPASSMVCAKYCAVRGVSRAGLRIIVHPAAIAAPALRVAIASGKFHGVMSRHGPTGLCFTSIWFLPSGVGW